MTRPPRTPLPLNIVKGQGALPEQIPAPPPRNSVSIAPPREPMTALTVRIPETMSEQLRQLAFQTRRGKGDLIVEAIARFLAG